MAAACTVAHGSGSLHGFGIGHFADNLLQADIGVAHQGLHGVDVFQRGIDADGVVNAEGGFADGIAAAGGAPQHLLKQNTRFYAAQKHQIANGGHINAGGKQIYGNGDFGIRLVFVQPDQLIDFIAFAGDFFYRSLMVIAAVDLAKAFV